MGQERKSTFALVSIAHLCFLQMWTGSSSVHRFLDDLPCSRLASTAASRTAFAPRLPIANLAVNCNNDDCVYQIQMTMLLS